MSPRLASASTSSPASAASTSRRSSSAMPGRAVALEERHLRLDHRHHPAEGLDAGPAERAQTLDVVAQAPGLQECARRIDARAQSGPRRPTASATRTPKLARPLHSCSTCSTCSTAATSAARSLRPHWRPRSTGPWRAARPRSSPSSRTTARASRSTFQGARGIAERGRAHLDGIRPGHQELTAPRPDATPPTPMMPASGKALRHSHTARTATGWSASPESPPPPAPSTGRPVSRSRANPRRVFVSVSPSAPARARRRRSPRCRARSGSA